MPASRHFAGVYRPLRGLSSQKRSWFWPPLSYGAWFWLQFILVLWVHTWLVGKALLTRLLCRTTCTTEHIRGDLELPDECVVNDVTGATFYTLPCSIHGLPLFPTRFSLAEILVLAGGAIPPAPAAPASTGRQANPALLI